MTARSQDGGPPDSAGQLGRLTHVHRADEAPSRVETLGRTFVPQADTTGRRSAQGAAEWSPRLSERQLRGYLWLRQLRRSFQQDGAGGMPPNDLLGHCRPTVMRVTEDDDIGAHFLRSLDNDLRDVMFGGVDELSVHRNSRCGKLVDSVLHYCLFTGGYVILAVKDTEPRPGVDVVDDHVAARNV